MKKPIALFKFESDGFLTKQEQDSITEKIKETLKEDYYVIISFGWNVTLEVKTA